MQDFRCREATPDEMAFVYMMGFDAWSGGKDARGYLSDCLDSPKYARGRWFVLTEGHWLCSSLIVYDLSPRFAGIGSLATTVDLRGRGHASRLAALVTERLLKEKEAVFLHSDIPAQFYERLGFAALPAAFQKKPGSPCMAKAKDLAGLLREPDFSAPDYF